MEILSRLANCSLTEQGDLDITFSQYDRMIQDEFLRYLCSALNLLE